MLYTSRVIVQVRDVNDDTVSYRVLTKQDISSLSGGCDLVITEEFEDEFRSKVMTAIETMYCYYSFITEQELIGMIHMLMFLDRKYLDT